MEMHDIINENARLKEELAEAIRAYKLLEEYYNVALTRLSEAGSEISRSQQKIARLEGKLDRARNIIRMMSGRENW